MYLLISWAVVFVMVILPLHPLGWPGVFVAATWATLSATLIALSSLDNDQEGW